ncbi:MAG: C1 family peptidase [Pseudomonadota bacterium]
MEGWNGNSLSGCIFEPAQMDAPIMSFAATQPLLNDTTLPASVDLRQYCTQVEDQGRINSCTANAAVGALEYHYARRDGSAPDLSRMYVYYNTRRLNGTIQKDGGARISEAMAAVLAYGACRSELWPYDPQRIAMEPPQQAYVNGLGHEALQYARVPGIEGAIRALAANLPVVFGCFLPKRCYEEAATTGRIPATRPDERRNPPNFGHAMLLVGYDLATKALLVRNSWGPNWGDGGYCWFPFEEAAASSPREAFWTLMSVEPRADLAVRTPATFAAANAASATPTPPAFGAGAAGTSGAGSAADNLRSQIRGEMDKLRAEIVQGQERLRSPLGGASAPPQTAPKLGSEPLKGPCYNCEGTGVCYQCRGSRQNTGYPCRACDYSGTCFYCAGTGRA